MLRNTFLIMFCFLGFTQLCFADISLSVNPVDGSGSLRFEKTPIAGPENYKEIRIRISSTNGNRYQVFQRILEPIMGEKGDTLNLQAMKAQTLIGSNSYGTLYLQNSDPLNMSDQLLYTSSANGQSDMFTIGYFLNQDLINAGGSFRGRLVFTVRGMGNGSNDQMMIDVFLETSPRLKVLVQGSHMRKRVHIKDSDTNERVADSVKISFSGNLGQEIRIYQELETMPENETGQDVGADVLQIVGQGETNGLHIQEPTSLREGRTLIYSSDKEEDNFVVYFLVNASQIQQQDAGIYRGRINYVIETDRGKREFPVDMQFDIGSVFSINVTAPGGVSFTHVIADSPPQEKQVTVTVVSNLHKPYQVIQDLKANMTNQQGKEFDSKYFSVQVEIPTGQKGQTDLTEFSPVQTGEYPVFSSDARGSGATFTVVYRLQGYAQMSAGDFSAPVILSLNQK